MNLPTYLQIEPVGQCNLRCQMCSIQFRQDGPPFGPLAFMPFDHFVQLVDGFPQLQQLHLQGLGEPMMHPRFWDMITYAAERGISVSTNSNMTLLNPRRAELCVSSGLSSLHFSVDGATKETYERIRVRARFERVVRNIELLQETRARLSAEFPELRMVVVVMRQNLHELPDLVRLAHGWGVQCVFVQHLCHDFGEGSLPGHYRPMREFVQQQTLLNENVERVERYFAEAREAASVLRLDLRLPQTRPKEYAAGTPGRARCNWPWSGAYVSYQGLAMPCCMVSTPDRINFGNMVEQGVQTVWDGAEFSAFRDRLDSTYPPDLCRSCAVYTGTF